MTPDRSSSFFNGNPAQDRPERVHPGKLTASAVSKAPLQLEAAISFHPK
jgi:hypothetical protein